MRQRQFPHGIRAVLARSEEPVPHDSLSTLLWVSPTLRSRPELRWVVRYQDRPGHKLGPLLRMEMWRFEAPWCQPEDMLNPDWPQWRPWRGLAIGRQHAAYYITGFRKLSLAIKDGSIDSLMGVPLHAIPRRHKGLYPTCIDRIGGHKVAGCERRVGIKRMHFKPDQQVYKQGFQWVVGPSYWLVVEPILRRALEEIQDESE